MGSTLTPDAFMASQQTPDSKLTPESFMASQQPAAGIPDPATAAAKADENAGIIAAALTHPGRTALQGVKSLWDAATTPVQQQISKLTGSPAPMTGEQVVAPWVRSAQDLAHTLAEPFGQVPLMGGVPGAVDKAAEFGGALVNKGLGGMIDAVTTPLGMALPGAEAAIPAAGRVAVKAGLTASMIPGAMKSAQKAGDNPTAANLGEAVASTGLAALPLVPNITRAGIKSPTDTISDWIDQHNTEAARLVEQDRAQGKGEDTARAIVGDEPLKVKIGNQQMEVQPLGSDTKGRPAYKVVDESGKPVFAGFGDKTQEFLRMRGAEPVGTEGAAADLTPDKFMGLAPDKFMAQDAKPAEAKASNQVEKQEKGETNATEREHPIDQQQPQRQEQQTQPEPQPQGEQPATTAGSGPGETNGQTENGVPVGNVAPETQPPQVAEGFTRMYHGGHGPIDGPRWFTSDPSYAAGYAAKTGNDAPVHYVDIPTDHPLIEPDYPEQTISKGFHQNVELPAEIATKAKPVVQDSVQGSAASSPEQAVVGRMFDSPAQLQQTAPEMRAKLAQVAPHVLQTEDRPGWNITPLVREATGILADAKTPNTSPDALAIARTLQQNPTAAARAFRQYANDEALSREGAQGGFFEPPTQREAFDSAFGGRPKVLQMKPFVPYSGRFGKFAEADAAYRETSAGRGHLYVNHPAMSLVSQVLHSMGELSHAAPAEGLTLQKEVVGQLHSVLSQLPASIPKASPAIRKLAAEVAKARDANDGITVVAQAGPEVRKVSDLKTTLRQEDFHREQFRLENQLGGAPLAGIGELARHPAMSKALAALVRIYGHNPRTLSLEAPAWIADGSYAKLGLSKEEAKGALWHYFDVLGKEHGAKALPLALRIHPELRKEILDAFRRSYRPRGAGPGSSENQGGTPGSLQNLRPVGPEGVNERSGIQRQRGEESPQAGNSREQRQGPVQPGMGSGLPGKHPGTLLRPSKGDVDAHNPLGRSGSALRQAPSTGRGNPPSLGHSGENQGGDVTSPRPTGEPVSDLETGRRQGDERGTPEKGSGPQSGQLSRGKELNDQLARDAATKPPGERTPEERAAIERSLFGDKSSRAVAPQPKPAAQPVGQTPNAGRILAAVRNAGPAGSPASIRALRQALPDLSKPDFDRAMLDLQKQGKLHLSEHDYPQSLSPADRAQLVEGTGKGRWGDKPEYNAATLYPNSERGSVPVDLLTLGVGHFVKDDVIPAVQQAASAIAESREAALRLMAPTMLSREAEMMGLSLRERMAQFARRMDQAEMRLRKADTFFDSRPRAQNYDFIDRMERNVPQENANLDQVAGAFRKMMDQRRREVQSLGQGDLRNFYEHYFPHIFENTGNAAKFTAAFFNRARSFEGSKSFLKHREFPTFKEALDAGQKPVSDNPVRLILMKAREMDRFLLAHHVLEDMAERGVAKLALTKDEQDQLPANYKRIADPVGGGRWYAEEGAADVMNNYLSPGIRHNGAYRILAGVNNTMNQANLGLSAFHLTGEIIRSGVSRAALGIEDFMRGRPMRGLGRIASFPAAPFLDMVKGSKILKEWYKPGSEGAPIAAMVHAISTGGGRAAMGHEFTNQAVKSFMTAARRGNLVGAAIRTPLAAIEVISKPMMESLIPRLKMSVFAGMAQDALERLGPGADVDAVRKAMASAWDSTDNRMGQVVYDNLFWNRTVKDVAHLVTRSVGWNLGTVRELGGAAVDAAKMLGGKKPEEYHRIAYAAALMFVTAVTSALYQYLHTGKGPQELKDYVFPKRGNSMRVAMPTDVKDVYHYVTDPVQTVENKTSPLVNTVMEMLHNRDFYNKPIRNPNHPMVKQMEEEAKFLGSQFLPFTLQHMLNKKGSADPNGEHRVEEFLGVTKAPQARKERLREAK